MESLGLRSSGESQNLSPGWISVWEGKPLEFQKETGISGAEGERQLAESEPIVDLGVGRKIIKKSEGEMTDFGGQWG